MEGQDYLNQISAKVRPTQQTKWDKLKSSKIFWVVTIGIVAFFAILIIGGMLGGNKNSGKNIAFSLKLRIDNVSGIINDYQPRVKSSELRSSSASLYSVLSNTNRDLTESITTLYGYEEGKIDSNLIEEAQTERDEVEANLYEARINGNLDRIYAHNIAYEISMIMTEESNLYDSTSDETLKKVVSDSYNSLENLYNRFNDFSETK